MSESRRKDEWIGRIHRKSDPFEEAPAPTQRSEISEECDFMHLSSRKESRRHFHLLFRWLWVGFRVAPRPGPSNHTL